MQKIPSVGAQMKCSTFDTTPIKYVFMNPLLCIKYEKKPAYPDEATLV